MALWSKLLFEAGKAIARNPRARAKAAEACREAVKPAAAAAWKKTKPALDAARADIRRIRAETPPGENPGRFAGRVARRLIDRARGASGK